MAEKFFPGPFKGLKLCQTERRQTGAGRLRDPPLESSAFPARRNNKWLRPESHKNLIELAKTSRLIVRDIGLDLLASGESE